MGLTGVAVRGAQDVAASDEGLRMHAGHLQYRWAKFVQRRRELEARPVPPAAARGSRRAPLTRAARPTQKYEGGLEEFSMVRSRL